MHPNTKKAFQAPITHATEGLSQFRKAKAATKRDERRALIAFSVEDAVREKLGPVKRIKS